MKKKARRQLADGEMRIVLAYHEAGHVIAHNYFGTEITRVFVNDGHVESGCSTVIHQWDYHSLRFVTTSVAGSVSDLMYQKKNWTLHRMLRTDLVNADNDHEAAIKILQTHYPNGNRVVLAIMKLTEHAREAKTLLQRWWSTVEVVAQRLIVAGEICQPELGELLEPMTSVVKAEDKADWDRILKRVGVTSHAPLDT
jgi:hypothetical protein